MSTDGQPHILAIGGGTFVPNDRYGLEPSPLLRYALDLTGEDRPRVCFLATAVGDGADKIARAYEAFSRLDAEVSHLALFPMPNIADMRAHLLNQDLVYVTGGSVVYGSIWGAYLPIIKKYADNGRLWWLNMQYYNGSMYGCSGDSYAAGTVQGFVAQTDCLNRGLVIQGTTIRVPYDKQVPGLPAQSGAGGGYMAPSLVAEAWQHYGGSLKGLMTWSINWDGAQNWTFGDNVTSLQGR